MIYFRLTPLWKMKDTEQWLNTLAEQGQILRAKYGSFYSFTRVKTAQNRNELTGFGLDFYEKGLENSYAPWYLKFNGITVPCFFSYYIVYKYRRSKTREQQLEKWYPYRDRFIKTTLINHLLLAIICEVVFPFICYLREWRILLFIAAAAFSFWILKNVYGLVIINRRLKHWKHNS